MSEEEYNRKLENLQKYIPFLENMIAQLRDPSKKNREQQLNKMESLHAMITDKKKKLKLETLNKCEEVISKLYLKVNHKPFQDATECSTELTPASPSPPPDKDFFDIAPVRIPTERLEPESVIQKIDIYSSAAESLRKTKSPEKIYCQSNLTDLSKPPISLEDLHCLEVDVQDKINESASLKELTEIRNKIASELFLEKLKTTHPFSKTDDVLKIDKLSSCIDSNSFELPSEEDNILFSLKSSPKESKEHSRNNLSAFDDKILEENTKKGDIWNLFKKNEKSNKRSEKSKEKIGFNEEKKTNDNSLFGDKNLKQKSLAEKTLKKRKEIDLKSTDNSNQDQRTVTIFNNNDTPNKSESTGPSRSINFKEINSEEQPPPPVIKRLADKYNPRPRKLNVDADVEKSVAESIEQNMKSLPPKIPVINRLTDPPPPPPASLVKCSQLEPELPKQYNPNAHFPSLLQVPVSRGSMLSTSHPINPSNSNILVSPRENFLSPPNSSLLMSPRDNFISQANSSLLMSPRDNYISPTNPPKLMSPRDNFVSDYVREDLNNVNHRRQRFDPIPSLIPPNNRFVPSNIGQRYKSQFKINYNQNQMDSAPQLDYQPPNIGPSNHQYNAIPPLLSPEIPLFHEQKPSFGHVNRDKYLLNEDLRWRLDDNRSNWERRDYDSRFRSPMTYKEHREKRENSRDPRVARDRDPREYKDNRDPRLNRDKFRDSNDNRDNKEKDKRDDRENKDVMDKGTRDPRLNKDLEKNRLKNKEDFRTNRYESKFDRMYSKTNKDQSRSSYTKSTTKEDDSFVSPLDSLYNVRERNTGKGYGIQTFRIPKKKKDEKVDITKNTRELSEPPKLISEVEDEVENKYTLFSSDVPKEKSSELSSLEESISNQSTGVTKINVNINDGYIPNLMKDDFESEYESVKTEKEIASQPNTELTTQTFNQPENSKQPDPKQNINVLIDLEEQLKPEVPEAQASRADGPRPSSEQTILAQFFANLLGSDSKKDKKTALYSLISTFSDTFTTKELSKITKIIQTNDDGDEVSEEDIPKKEDEADKKEDDMPKKEASKKGKKSPKIEKDKKDNLKNDAETTNLQEDSKVNESEENVPSKISKRSLRKRRLSSTSLVKQSAEATNDETTAVLEISKNSENSDNTENNPINTDIESEVLVTVGERIKSRKRNAAVGEKPKKKSELDKLHEDIREMFIRDGVLTASGKRMCYLLKDDPSVLNTSETNDTEDVDKTRKKLQAKLKYKQPNENEIKTMKNVRVIIHKIPDTTMEESISSRRLTRSMTAPDSDEESEILTKDGGTDLEGNNESSDLEKESSPQSSDNVQKTKTLKRKRPKSSWSVGIIKKKKKKQTTDETSSQKSTESEEQPAQDTFVAPNKEYFVDFISQKSFACKLCDFQGKFITSHYKATHPESEVMSSRLTPTLATEAIKDANTNMAKYEMYQLSKPSMKINYACRICNFSTIIYPTLFYDHITTHTGEYRHICPNCNASFCSAKSLKVHINHNHKGEEKPIVRKSFSSLIIFGYVCGECNYIQMNKKHVEEHVNIYHLVTPTIYKINLSTIFDEEIVKLYNADKKNALDSDNNLTDSEPEKSLSVKENEEKDQLQFTSNNHQEENDNKETKKDEEHLKQAEKCNSKVKCKKPRLKPSSKTKKKLMESSNLDEETAIKTETNKISIRRSVDILDPDKILPLRSKRAAKEKAQEKLREFMEMNDSSAKGKTSSEGSKEDSINENEVDSKINEKSFSTAGEDTEIIDKETERAKVELNLKPVKKEIDMNVFTCNTDIQEENKKIEQERLLKMDELNKSVGSRTSLNFVDKLCNRLSQNEVVIKEEPKDEFTEKMHQTIKIGPPVIMPVFEHNPVRPDDELTHLQIKNPILETESQPSTHTFDVSQKNDKVILDMIEKLKGKLGADDNFNVDSVDDDENEGPPPLTHVNDLTNIRAFSASTETLEICGLLKVIKTDESMIFCCLVPPCVFTTENRDLFQIHCKENHSAAGLRNSTLCETCGVQVNSTSDFNLLENVLKHVMDQHTDFVGSSSPDTPLTIPPQTIRIRKLSGDALSAKKDDETKRHKIEEMVEDYKNNKDSAEEVNAVDNEIAEENPFPFKIADVMSLAEPQPPPLTPITKQNLQIVVKEAKLTAAEIAKPRKTQKAISKFIIEAGNLYKCPHFYCLFTTNNRESIENHLKTHNIKKDAMIPCVYCDMKTPWEHVPIHIDIRHGCCKFACSYCLYRACLKDYVFLHQDREHAFQDYSVIALPTPKTKKFALADLKIDPMTLCNPYKCSNDCKKYFLFENEFREHVMSTHNNPYVICGHDKCTSRIMRSKIIHHWSAAHGVSVYQCGYCKANSNELQVMYHHLSQNHQNLLPEILVRIITPQSAVPLGFSIEAFKRMRKIATLPSITEGEKASVVPSKNKPPDAAKSVPNSVTHITKTVTTSTKTILNPTSTVSITSAANSLFIVTSSASNPNSILKVNRAPNSLLKTNKSNIDISPESSVTLTSIGSTGESTADPLDITEAPVLAGSPEQSAYLMENLDVSMEPVNINLLNDSIASTEENSTATISNIVPLEHVNLSEENNEEGQTAECDIDPLDLGESINSQNIGYSSEEESEKSKKQSALIGYQLYRCAFCEFSCTHLNDFKKHASKSVQCKSTESLNKPYICVHCKKPFKNAHILSEHIQCHGVLRYSCSLCGNKFPTPSQARGHMKYRHNVGQTTLTLFNTGKSTVGGEEYIIKPKSLITDTLPKENTCTEPSSSSSVTEQIYQPDQIDRIPIRSIFSSDLKCAVCNYTTKVRTNMVRHLQFHSQEKSVPDTAPVNPVPCLEKNEKMFDKMINLASSSHKSAGRMGGVGKTEPKDDNIPDFVPSHTRYACCAQNCNYICPEEGNLRHHLMALHGEEALFICVHCKAQLVDADADIIIKHLKLHGLQLYKCPHCYFVHNLKHKIEKHCSDVHVELPTKVITVRLMESEPKSSDNDPNHVTPPTVVVQSKLNKPWRCCMCKTKSNTQEGIQTHVFEKHEIDAQFKCALCVYKTNEKSTFGEHFKNEHENQEINIIHIYQKIEEDHKEDKDVDAFDTTPLWQRDRPRVRHIRGILFDESSPVTSKNQKKPTKAPSNAAIAKSLSRNLDLAIDAVASGKAEVLKDNSGEFIEQINKLMKHTQPPNKNNEDIIIVDDEEEACNNVIKSTAVKASNRKTTVDSEQPEKKKLKLEEIIDVEYIEDDMSELSLLEAFGDFGQPLNKQLKCPQCNKFKSKKISDFIFHLFKEKKVYRYKCGICGDESITYKYMAKHVKEHSIPFDINNVITMPRNTKLEVWLQMLIRIQCVKIVSSLSAPVDVPASEGIKVLCRYCNKWFKSEQERNEHAIFHWNCVPFKCSECNYVAFTRIQMTEHFNLMHSRGKVPNIIENGPTVSTELQFSDFLHMKEVEKEMNKLKPIDVSPDESMAEVLVPEVVISDMVDESKQDGTDQNMTVMLDHSIKSLESELAQQNFMPVDNDDLVIVTKTDTNVPRSGDAFCCEYCPFMSNSEMLMLSHISGQHEHMHIKFKVLNRDKCEKKIEDYVACTICNEIGSEIRIRQHHLELHEGETFNIYRYTCCGCQKKFIKMNGLKMHFQRVHPGVAVKYIGIFDNLLPDLQKPGKDNLKNESLANNISSSASNGKVIKHYQCTVCSYNRYFTSNGIGNIRAHVRCHYKAYVCGKCSSKWRTRTDALNHFRKDHAGFLENIIHDKETEDVFHNAVKEICESAVPIPNPEESLNASPGPSQNSVKTTARKSTASIQLPLQEYSYYGNPVEKVDLNKIMTSVEVNGLSLEMSAEKLGQIFDLNPSVYVEKCDASSEDSVIEIDS